MKRLRVRDLEQECQSLGSQAFCYPQTYPIQYKLKTKCCACKKKSGSREILYCDGRLVSVCPRCGDRQCVPMEYLRLLDRRRNTRVAWGIVLLCLLGTGLLVFLLTAFL